MKCLRSAPVGMGSGLSDCRVLGKVGPRPMAGRRLAANQPARLAARPGHRTVRSPVCMADLLGVASTVPAIATSVAFAWGALILSQNVGHADQGGKSCPTCGGTGIETCFCNRWSDGDAGCHSCNHTGYMKCRSCGGGGTAVPIALSVRKDDSAGRQL